MQQQHSPVEGRDVYDKLSLGGRAGVERKFET